MAAHNELGKKGEDKAGQYLVANGYEILEHNYQYGKGEIDIICRKDDLLIFVEVKTRKTNAWGYPEMAVTKKKASLMMRTAYAYMEKVNHEWEIRFDIIAITMHKEGEELKHFEDAFVP